MSIESYLRASVGLFQRGEYEASMLLVSCCADATAKDIYGQAVGSRIKKFVRANYDIFTRIGFAGAYGAVPGGTIAVNDPVAPTTIKSIEEIVYKVVRCSLVHDAQLPTSVRFTSESTYGFSDSGFVIPTNFILALLLCVVAAPCNSGIRLGATVHIAGQGYEFHLDELAGNATRVRAILAGRRVDEPDNLPLQ
jgi:hypothetical protein